jgi:hypothetical protein
MYKRECALNGLLNPLNLSQEIKNAIFTVIPRDVDPSLELSSNVPPLIYEK